MRAKILLVLTAAMLGGCSWFHHDENDHASRAAGNLSGPDAGPGRGTTGVSSGADSARGITGSDAAPPR